MIDTLLEKNVLPDWLIRMGIRRLLAQRLRDEEPRGDPRAAKEAYVHDLKHRPVAEDTRAANEEHYEVPTRFFQMCLGRRLKYSGCYFPTGGETLEQAEEAMLGLYVERARIADGQEILELGCGWGSLSLYLAERFPGARITGVSNSRTQKRYIDAEAERRSLKNLSIITCDMNQFRTDKSFDRVVSVEMFEHMRNWREVFHRINGWLNPGGLFFMHLFVHRTLPYLFTVEDDSDWMSRHFFSGGMMPSDGMPARFQDSLRLVRQWRWNGQHYEKTANAWLANMDKNKDKVWPILAETYGAESAQTWWVRWRLFFMACAELWGYKDGQEWWVSHYLFERNLDCQKLVNNP